MRLRMLKRILSLGLLASLSSVTFPVPAAAQSASLQTKAPVIAPPIAAKQWTGDLDVLLQHRVIRVAVPYSKTFYYEVDGVQYGVAYEAGKAFEEFLNKKYPQKNKNIKIHILFLVTPREKMYAQLTGGNVDIVTGGLSITPERQKLVDFSDPTAEALTRSWSPALSLRNLPPSTIWQGRKSSCASCRATGNIWSGLTNAFRRKIDRP